MHYGFFASMVLTFSLFLLISATSAMSACVAGKFDMGWLAAIGCTIGSCTMFKVFLRLRKLEKEFLQLPRPVEVKLVGGTAGRPVYAPVVPEPPKIVPAVGTTTTTTSTTSTASDGTTTTVSSTTAAPSVAPPTKKADKDEDDGLPGVVLFPPS